MQLKNKLKKLAMKTRLGRLICANEINEKLRARMLVAHHEIYKAKQIVERLSAYGRDATWRNSAVLKMSDALDALKKEEV